MHLTFTIIAEESSRVIIVCTRFLATVRHMLAESLAGFVSDPAAPNRKIGKSLPISKKVAVIANILPKHFEDDCPDLRLLPGKARSPRQ